MTSCFASSALERCARVGGVSSPLIESEPCAGHGHDELQAGGSSPRLRRRRCRRTSRRPASSLPDTSPGACARVDARRRRGRSMGLAPEEAAAIKLPSKPQSWTTLGSAWVRMARESWDPGYYLNADACAEMALRASPGDPAALDLRAMVLLNRPLRRGARPERAPRPSGRGDSIAYGTLTTRSSSSVGSTRRRAQRRP